MRIDKINFNCLKFEPFLGADFLFQMDSGNVWLRNKQDECRFDFHF